LHELVKDTNGLLIREKTVRKSEDRQAEALHPNSLCQNSKPVPAEKPQNKRLSSRGTGAECQESAPSDVVAKLR